MNERKKEHMTLRKLAKSLKRLSLVVGLALVAGRAMALNILLTNDDGFETQNIQALFQALKSAGHDVIMTAPYLGQSGTGGQVAFMRPIAPTTRPSQGGLLPVGSPGVGPTGIAPQQYYVDGSPSASVLYGLDVIAPQIWGKAPDLVISGPNEGNNLGIVTPHSGTLGATVTALNKGIPAIAVSAEGDEADAAQVVAALMVKLVASLDGRRGVDLPYGIGLNVNTPAIAASSSSVNDFEFRFTRIGASANFGLQFFDNLGDSPVAVGLGIPADINLPGVAVAPVPSSAGYAEDSSKRSESNALAPLIVTVSPIQGTYAASPRVEGAVRGRLRTLFSGKSKR